MKAAAAPLPKAAAPAGSLPYPRVQLQIFGAAGRGRPGSAEIDAAPTRPRDIPSLPIVVSHAGRPRGSETAGPRRRRREPLDLGPVPQRERQSDRQPVPPGTLCAALPVGPTFSGSRPAAGAPPPPAFLWVADLRVARQESGITNRSSADRPPPPAVDPRSPRPSRRRGAPGRSRSSSSPRRDVGR